MFEEGDVVVYVGNAYDTSPCVVGSLHTIMQVEKVGNHMSDILLSDLYWYSSEDFKLYLDYNNIWNKL